MARIVEKKIIERSLCLNSASDYSIDDENGNKVTIDEARRLWDSGVINNWNIAFARLVANCFDIEKTKQSYRRK